MAGETVVRIRRTQTGTDRYGSPTFGPAVETPLDGAFFDPGGSQEPVEVGRASVVTKPRCYWLRSWPDVTAGDQLRVRGIVYGVQGRPADWRDPFGSSVGGLVVELEAVEG